MASGHELLGCLLPTLNAGKRAADLDVLFVAKFFENFSCQQMDTVRRRSYPAFSSQSMLFAVVTLVYALALGNATSRIWYSPPSVFATKCCPPQAWHPKSDGSLPARRQVRTLSFVVLSFDSIKMASDVTKLPTKDHVTATWHAIEKILQTEMTANMNTETNCSSPSFHIRFVDLLAEHKANA